MFVVLIVEIFSLFFLEMIVITDSTAENVSQVFFHSHLEWHIEFLQKLVVVSFKKYK